MVADSAGTEAGNSMRQVYVPGEVDTSCVLQSVSLFLAGFSSFLFLVWFCVIYSMIRSWELNVKIVG